MSLQLFKTTREWEQLYWKICREMGLAKIQGFDDIAKLYEPMLNIVKKVLIELYKMRMKE